MDKKILALFLFSLLFVIQSAFAQIYTEDTGENDWVGDSAGNLNTHIGMAFEFNTTVDLINVTLRSGGHTGVSIFNETWGNVIATTSLVGNVATFSPSVRINATPENPLIFWIVSNGADSHQTESVQDMLQSYPIAGFSGRWRYSGYGNDTTLSQTENSLVFTIDYFNVEVVFACVEDWTANYTTCTIGDNQTLTYTDGNACGTFVDLPGDNGTISGCNYCTMSSHIEQTGCVNFEITTFSVYDNFATCCNLTNLASDCTLPGNTTTGCAGIHQASDTASIIIDGIVEIGISLISYVPVIVVVGGIVVVGLIFF